MARLVLCGTACNDILELVQAPTPDGNLHHRKDNYLYTTPTILSGPNVGAERHAASDAQRQPDAVRPRRATS